MSSNVRLSKRIGRFPYGPDCGPCIRLAVSGAVAKVIFADPESILHTLQQEGPLKALAYIQTHFLDRELDHRTRINIAWTFWQAQKRDEADRQENFGRESI